MGCYILSVSKRAFVCFDRMFSEKSEIFVRIVRLNGRFSAASRRREKQAVAVVIYTEIKSGRGIGSGSHSLAVRDNVPTTAALNVGAGKLLVEGGSFILMHITAST